MSPAGFETSSGRGGDSAPIPAKEWARHQANFVPPLVTLGVMQGRTAAIIWRMTVPWLSNTILVAGQALRLGRIVIISSGVTQHVAAAR